MFDFKCTSVYLANKKSTAQIVINQGGTGSSKTYSILQLIIEVASCQIAPKNDPIITVTSSSIPNLKRGAYRVFLEILSNNQGIYNLIENINQTDRTFTFKTGWIVEFNSYQTQQEAKQGKRQYLFVNEANGLKNYFIFWELCARTYRTTWIDYNPTAPFWVHEKLINTNEKSNDLYKSVDFIRSDHRANPFLTKQQHDAIENIKDKELWRVYARGLTGNVSGLIFPNWKAIKDGDFPDADFIGGIDWGYTNDPTALVKVCIIGNSIYVKELCYDHSLSITNINQIAISNGFNANTPIYADHDPEQIAQLRRFGLFVLPSKKGQGSIKAGIDFLKQKEVYYTEGSKNLREELIRYEWLKDLETGMYKNMPIDKHNHLIDAVRMSVFTHFFR